MSDKERMLSRKLYLANGSELSGERTRAKTLCRLYNLLEPARLSDEGGRILRELFGRLGDGADICQPFYCDYGYNIEAGDKLYVNHNCVVLDVDKVVFGANVMIGPNCGFYTAGHPLDARQRVDGWEFGRPIRVGDNVWFGGNVVVLPGVEIGDNTVVGAGSVVAKSLPAGVLAVGNPCRILRKIAADDIIRD